MGRTTPRPSAADDHTIQWHGNDFGHGLLNQRGDRLGLRDGPYAQATHKPGCDEFQLPLPRLANGASETKVETSVNRRSPIVSAIGVARLAATLVAYGRMGRYRH
jgi:hypothetical protein